MIKLDNIKHIFVDFDDTLVIHDHNSHIYEKNKSIKDAILGNDAYPYSVPNKAVITLLRNAEKEQIEIHVLSWVNISLETKVKEEYCHRHFPGLVSDVIGTASPEKTEFMLAFAEAKGIRPENIMFIDDRIDTLRSAKDAGFVVYSPQYILNTDIKNLPC